MISEYEPPGRWINTRGVVTCGTGNYGGYASMGPAYWILSTALLAAMGTLIVTLNHLAHKEYSEELERLRRDVLAGQSAALRQEPEPLRRQQELCRHLNSSLERCSLRLQATSASLRRMEESQLSANRKRSIQEDVTQLSREFRLAFNQKLADMEDSLNDFMQREVKFCLDFKKNLGDNLHRRSVELSAVSEQVASLVESQTHMIQDVEKRSTDQVSNTQQWIQQLLSVTRATSDAEVNSLHNFLTDSFLPVIQNLQHQILLQKSEIQGLNRQMNEQLQQHVESVQGFTASQSDSLAQLRDTILQQSLDQQRQLERARDLGRGLLRAKRNFGKELSSQLEQATKHVSTAQDLWSAHLVETNQTLSDMDGGIGMAYDASDKLLHAATTGLDSHIKRAADMSSNYESQTEDMLENVSGFVERATSNMAGAERYRDDMEVGVRGAVASSEGTWREHYHRTEQDLRKLSESLRVEQQNHQEHRQMLVTALRESAETHEATLEQQRLDFSTFVRERQDDLESQCSYAAGWSHTMTSELRQRDQDMEEFLIDDLRREVPRGYSPLRQHLAEQERLDRFHRLSHVARLSSVPSLQDATEGPEPATDAAQLFTKLMGNTSLTKEDDESRSKTIKKPRRRMEADAMKKGSKVKATSRKS